MEKPLGEREIKHVANQLNSNENFQLIQALTYVSTSCIALLIIDASKVLCMNLHFEANASKAMVFT
jgi:hypothetical protein